jgi:formylglycine-generating enzyme required for sulfatase activity
MRVLLVCVIVHFVSACALAQAPKEITNSIGMKFVLIPGGTFKMGSPPSEEGSLDDEVQHEVTISKDYYLGAFEVTQSQYQQIMGKNPSIFEGKKMVDRIPPKKHPKTGRTIEEAVKNPIDTNNYPVDSITKLDAIEFCKRLSRLPEERKARRGYRLPTEAEWEFACRAGSNKAYSFGDRPELLKDYSWFSGNSNNHTHPVGEKMPNAWGLYDMHGNVWEWCSDWYGDYSKTAVTDPTGPREGTSSAMRGGGWGDEAAACRSATRNRLNPYSEFARLGFRVALSPSGTPK